MNTTRNTINEPAPGAYKRKLLLALVLANLFVSALGASAAWLSYDQALRKIESLAVAFSQHFAVLLESRIDRITSYQNLIAYEMAEELAHPEQPSQMDALITALDPTENASFSARVIGEDGHPIHSRDLASIVNNSYIDRDYFKQLRAHPELPYVMSSPLWGKFTKQPSIVFARAFRKPDGSFGGIILMSITLAYLRELQPPSSTSIGDAITIRDTRDLALISRAPSTREDDLNIGKLATADKFIPGKPYIGKVPEQTRRLIASGATSGLYTTDQGFDDTMRTIAIKTISNAPLLVSASMSHNSAHFGNLHIQIIGTLIFCIAFLLLSLYAARQLLTREERLETSRGELAELNANLERLVEARTADLEDAVELNRRTSAELAHTDRLASLGDMAAGVAHELNTPLGNALLGATAIIGATRDLAAALRPENGAAPQRSKIDRIVNRIDELAHVQELAATRSAELVQAFKQVAVDQASLRRRSFDLRETVASVLASMRPSLSRAEIPMAIEIDIPEGIVCDSFPGALSQITANILQNASRHAFQGKTNGRLTITARVDAVADADDSRAPSAVILFEDDGNGIPDLVRPRLFEPYFTTQANHGGSGLGLSLSKKLAENVLNGKLEAPLPILGETGKIGAVFRLSFPIFAAST